MPGDGAAAKNGAKPERAREINITYALCNCMISVRRSVGRSSFFFAAHRKYKSKLMTS
jgi:hypothetical protein